MRLKYVVEEECLVKDYVLKLNLSKRMLKKIKNRNGFYINGESAKNFFPLKKGDVLELEFFEKMNDEYEESDIDLNIVYEDEYMIIIDKQNNIASQPSNMHLKDNVLSMAKSYFKKKGIDNNIHLVNRLDFATSGLLIISKSSMFHYLLSKVKIEKRYICEVEGFLEKESDIIETYIDRYKAPNIKRFVSDKGKLAITEYKVIKRKENSSYVEVLLHTGRCHQIRLHMAYLNCPIIGDKLYGNALEDDNDVILHLHAYKLSFVHPITEEFIEIESACKW